MAVSALTSKHLLDIDELSREQVEFILDTAQELVEVSGRSVKKVPPLRGKSVVNLFYEVSTRTRVSFEIAAKRLSADVTNVMADSSSITKGETLKDTVLTLKAIAADLIVIRHPQSGAAHYIAKHIPGVSVINAGDGLHAHPTQALLDALTIRQSLGRLDNLKIVLAGDVLRGRVARSNILLHKLFGNEIRVVAPPTIARKEFSELGTDVYYDLEEALQGADVVMSLRMKMEYLEQSFVPSAKEYAKYYCIREEQLRRCAPNSIVLAPGPFIREVELESRVIDGPRSRIFHQASNGIPVRMSVMFLLSQQLERERAIEREQSKVVVGKIGPKNKDDERKHSNKRG